LPDPITERTRKRIAYDPKTVHNYTGSEPVLVEIKVNNWVNGSQSEIEKYRREIN